MSILVTLESIEDPTTDDGGESQPSEPAEEAEQDTLEEGCNTGSHRESNSYLSVALTVALCVCPPGSCPLSQSAQQSHHLIRPHTDASNSAADKTWSFEASAIFIS